MIEFDEDALICDFAETYHIFDYRSLPARLAATLAAGLRDDSRIKLKAAGVPVGLDTVLLAAIADRVEAFRFGFSKEAEKGKMPPLLVNQILGEHDKKTKNKTMSFRTADEFEKAYAQIIGDK